MFQLPSDSFELSSWLDKLDDISISQQQLDELVMDFLVVEGYKDTAEAFASESGLNPGVNLSSISDRMDVRAAIINGDIMQARDILNNIDVEILEKDKKLFFCLQIQHLIELIKQGKTDDAISYAQTEIASHQGDPDYHFDEFLPTLEEVMALLLWKDPKHSPLSGLTDGAKRLQVASSVNAAILQTEAQTSQSKLPALLEAMLACQSKLASKHPIPEISLQTIQSFIKNDTEDTVETPEEMTNS
ncbi:hypothetical protein GEMRC1_010619 [Eukaryota sp. GEM-RC1]